MDILIVLSIVVFWFTCGAFAYGLNLAFFQFRYPNLAKKHYNADMRMSIVAFFIGPCSLFTMLNREHFSYGLLFKKPVKMHDRVEFLETYVFKKVHKDLIITGLHDVTHVVEYEFNRGPRRKFEPLYLWYQDLKLQTEA